VLGKLLVHATTFSEAPWDVGEYFWTKRGGFVTNPLDVFRLGNDLLNRGYNNTAVKSTEWTDLTVRRVSRWSWLVLPKQKWNLTVADGYLISSGGANWRLTSKDPKSMKWEDVPEVWDVVVVGQAVVKKGSVKASTTGWQKVEIVVEALEQVPV
jgi:hypothetical protein